MKTFKLENQPKIKSGFQAPEHYFDDFSVKVLEQIKDREVKVVPMYRRKIVISLLAAAVVIIALMTPFINNYNNVTVELDEKALETYLAYQANLNQYDLLRELDNADMQGISESMGLEDEILEDILSSNPNIENLISE